MILECKDCKWCSNPHSALDTQRCELPAHGGWAFCDTRRHIGKGICGEEAKYFEPRQPSWWKRWITLLLTGMDDLYK